MLTKIIEQCQLRKHDHNDLAQYIGQWATARSVKRDPIENIALLWGLTRTDNKDLAAQILKVVPQIEGGHLLSLFRVVSKTAKSDLEEHKTITFLQDMIALSQEKDNQELLQWCTINMLCECDLLPNQSTDIVDTLMSNDFSVNRNSEAFDMIVGCALALSKNDESEKYIPTANQLHWALRVATKDFMGALVTAKTDLSEKTWVKYVVLDDVLQRLAKNWTWLSNFDPTDSADNQLGWLFKLFEQQNIPQCYTEHFGHALKYSTVRSVVNHKMIDITPEIVAWLQRSVLKENLGRETQEFMESKNQALRKKI